MKNETKKQLNLFNRIQGSIVIFLTTTAIIVMNSTARSEVNVADFLEWASPLQIAKVEKTYDQVIGEKINWGFYSSGAKMADAMAAGEIDIAFSQGMAPFVSAVNANVPIKIVGIALAYDSADDCIIRNALGITKDNIKKLEGQKIALPMKSMAEYGFRMTMRHLGVDINKIELIDQDPADAAFMLLETEVAAACAFGKNSISKMKRVGKPILTNAEKKAAGMTSFDVISVTEKFAREKPEALRRFLKVTAAANAAFARDKSKIGVIAKDAGLTVEQAMAQITEFSFPTVDEQLNLYFSESGFATTLLPFMGEMFATDKYPKKADYSQYIDTSFLKSLN